MSDSDLYGVLGVNADASELEIKKAYVKKIREYPPELKPDEFKKIRSAYETLSNQQTRKEYDTMSVHGEEINELLDLGLMLMEEHSFYEAAEKFKKIIMIEPSLNYVRNYYALSLSYMETENREKAILQFQKLIAMEPENPTYLYNLGCTLQGLGKYDEALAYLKKGYLIDPDNVDITFAIVEIYNSLNNSQKAKDILELAMSKIASADFRAFIYLFKFLQVDILSKNYIYLNKTFSRIEALLEYNLEEKSYVANRYAKLAYELLDYKEFELAYYLTEKSTELDPNDGEILELHNYVAIKKPLYAEFVQLDKDEQISDYVKRIIILYLFGDEVSEEEYVQYKDEAFEDIFKASKYISAEITKSIRRIIIHYPLIFDEYRELLQKVMESSKYYELVNSQYQLMKEDQIIINAHSRLISFYLADDLSENEKDRYFDEIMDEMGYEASGNISRSVRRLKVTYPQLYELNNEFFEQIAAEADRISRNSSSSNSGRNFNASNASDSSSCFVATVAYGSPLTEELDLLRLWRDSYLRKSRGGMKFISFYYRYGPLMANIVGKSNFLKHCVRSTIYAIIKYLNRKYDL